MIAAPRPGKPGKSPLSRMSPSSSSFSSTTIAKPSSSSTSSTERTKLDPRKDSSSGGDSRTPLGWFFKKRMKEQSNENESASSNSVDINVESPVRPQHFPAFRLTDPDVCEKSESGRSIYHDNVPPEQPPQPSLLSPDYRFSVMTGEPSTSTPKTRGGSQNLPPLSEFTNLISPGQGGVPTDLPPGFVPTRPLTDQVQQGDRGGGQPPRRSASTRSKRKDKEPVYEAAPLTAGVHYPTPPPGADTPRSKSRASRSSRQGQVPGSLSTP
jgi:hypothetical protein